MVSELENTVSAPSESEPKSKGSAGYEIISWLNRSIKKYKEHPPKELVEEYLEKHPELTYEEAEKKLDFEDLQQFLLKKLDAGYSEYVDHPDMPSGKLMKEILDSKA
ncbi:MAG: hypothetical protein E7253_09600 [Lachnospiraceae bacterium]|nr:hypothetical protein [Lachnospiraceae bacterium]